MYLSTHDLLLPNDAAQHFPEPVNTVGWTEVCKGLYGILCGYLLIFGTVIGAVALVVLVVVQLAAAHPHDEASGAVSVLIIGALVLVLLVLAGYAVIIRSLWRCLRNAPEHCGAKWWIFATMICIAAGPAMGTATSLAGTTEQAVVAPKDKPVVPKTLRELLAESKKSGVGAAAAPMKIISSGVGLLGQLFFIFFLRSVALAFGDQFRARFAEMYLLLTGALFVGLVGLVVHPEFFMARPLLLVLLAGGWVLSAVWYFVLIISTCFCIQGNVAKLRALPVEHSL